MPGNGHRCKSGEIKEHKEGEGRVGILLPLGAGTFELKCEKGRGLRQCTLRNKQTQPKALEKNLRDKLGKEKQGGLERILPQCEVYSVAVRGHDVLSIKRNVLGTEMTQCLGVLAVPPEAPKVGSQYPC